MRILILGKTGQVASSLIEVGSARSLDIQAIGRPELDITSYNSVENTLNRFAPNIVINATAYTMVDQAETDIEEAYKINFEAVKIIASCCSQADIPIVHISTDYVFDGLKTEPYLELDQTNPESIYGKSKLKGERAISEESNRYIILRTSWIYSEIGNNFVKTMLKLAESHDEISVVSDQIGNPTYARHLAENILDIVVDLKLEGEEKRWGLYHISGQGKASWFDLATRIFELTSKNNKTVPKIKAISSSEYPVAAKRPLNSCLDCQKVKNAFSINLPVWQDGLECCLKKLYKNENLSIK